MKRYTALFTAILFVLVLAGGGLVYLFNTAHALSNPYYTLPIKPNEAPYDGGLFIGTWNNYNLYSFNTSSAPSDVVYAGRVATRAVVNSYWVSLSPNQSIDNYYYSGSWMNRAGGSLNNTYDYNGTTLYFFAIGLQDTIYDITLGNTYYSLDELMAEAVNLLNYTPPPQTHTYNFTIQAGYAAFIEYDDDIDVSLNAQMYDLSTLWVSGPQPGFWPQDLAQIGTYSSLPSVGDTFDNTGFSYIPWERGSDRNLLNQTKTAVYTDTIFYNNIPYAVVYNPAYYVSDLNSGEVKLSPSINITVENAISVRIVSILQGAINNVDDLQVNSSNDVEPDGTVVDSDDNPVNLPDGGGNYVPSNSDMTSTLSKLVSDIDNFFNGTWQYVRQLINSIGSFPQMVVELYSWLPTEYKTVLFSAFSIVVVVGVLKVML